MYMDIFSIAWQQLISAYQHFYHRSGIMSGTPKPPPPDRGGYILLAHLWRAYAIPVALSGIRCVSSVYTISTNQDITSIFGANVHHVPGLCLLGIGGAPYISHKIMAQKSNFHTFYFFSETTSRWCFILW